MKKNIIIAQIIAILALIILVVVQYNTYENLRREMSINQLNELIGPRLENGQYYKNNQCSYE